MRTRFFLLLGVATTCLHAGTIFSDFGPGSDQISTLGSGERDAWASAFTTDQTYDLTNITVALGLLSGSTNSAVVEIDSDASGVPGAILESWTVSVPPEGGGAQFLPTESVADQIGLVLQASTQYWVEIASVDPTSQILFNDRTDTNPAPLYGSDGSGGWAGPFAASLAFEVDGTPASSSVPEPGTASSLLLAGLLGLAGRVIQLRKRQKLFGCRGPR